MTIGKPLIKVEDWSHEDQRRALRAFWRAMGPVILEAVTESFEDAKMAHVTRTEVRHRTEMAKALVGDMVGLRWSTPRIRDVLPRALSLKLLGLELDLGVLGRRATW